MRKEMGMLTKAGSVGVFILMKKYIKLSNWYGNPLLPASDVITKRDRGNPHISVKSAIMNPVIMPLCFHFRLPTIPVRKKSKKNTQYNDKEIGSICVGMSLPVGLNLTEACRLLTSVFEYVSCFWQDKFFHDEFDCLRRTGDAEYCFSLVCDSS
jgi:hypothetical protein